MNFESVFSYLQETFTERLPYFPPNIRSSLFIILFCLVAVAELYVYILLKRIDRAYNKRQQKKWLEQVQNNLANLVIYDEDESLENTVQQFYQPLKNLSDKNIIVNKMLVNEILIHHKNFTGKTALVLSMLFKKIGLDKKTKQKIKNSNWEVKVDGIREARQMGLLDIASQIFPYTDDENGLLRMEAQAAYLKLASSNPFRFLDRAQERILDWHQLVLFEAITKSKKLEIPSFCKWLYSPNDTVVVLCLKLIDFYMQFDASEELVRLLSHQNQKIRKLSIQILGKLEIDSAERIMFEMYFDSSEEIKLEILKTFGRISSGKYTDFLASRIFSSNYQIKETALRALKQYPVKGREILINLMKESTLQNQKMINHVLDDRIKI